MERKLITKTDLPMRFSKYRVQPVVETTAPDGFERSYQSFATVAEAEAEMRSFEERPVIDGAEGHSFSGQLTEFGRTARITSPTAAPRVKRLRFSIP
jgi:hypothetical protein